MGRVVVSEFVTLDGVIEDAGGAEGFERGGWAFEFERGSEGDQFKLDEMMAAESLLLGRVTYEGFAEAWPGQTDEAGFADKMNSMPKYVVSSTLDKADWSGSTLIIEHDLVDEYRLMVYPIVLGSGKKLFGDTSGTSSLKLTDTKPTGDCVILTLEPARS